MRKVNLISVDLNLLVILEALLEEQQVTKAAERLHMSQPAVSRALQRLRETFADPLLVRSREGHDLTARAQQLQEELKTTLQRISQMIEAPRFEPATATQTVRFAGPDLEMALFVPNLLAAMHEQAPGMRVELDSQPADPFEMLARGEIHFAITGLLPETGMDQLHRILLESTELAIIMRNDHPLAQVPMTLDTYLSARHGYIALTGKGPMTSDLRLKELGKKRNTVLRLTSFMAVADFCEKTDLLFMLPLKLIQHLAAGRNVMIREVPPELKRDRALNLYLYWHKRNHKDPMHMWVREQLLQGVKDN